MDCIINKLGNIDVITLLTLSWKYETRCDGLECQPVQNVVLLPIIIDLWILHMTHICERSPRVKGYAHVCQRMTSTLTSLNTVSAKTMRDLCIV